MTYCRRCGGIILTDMPTEFIRGKEYHAVCALKEAHKRIPLRKEETNANPVPQDPRFVDTLPPN